MCLHLPRFMSNFYLILREKIFRSFEEFVKDCWIGSSSCSFGFWADKFEPCLCLVKDKNWSSRPVVNQDLRLPQPARLHLEDLQRFLPLGLILKCRNIWFRKISCFRPLLVSEKVISSVSIFEIFFFRDQNFFSRRAYYVRLFSW